MREKITFMFIAACFMAASAVSAADSEVAELKKMVLSMQKELTEQKKITQNLQEQLMDSNARVQATSTEIDRLKTNMDDSPAEKSGQDVLKNAKLNLLPEAIRTLTGRGMLTMGGELRTEYRILHGRNAINTSIYDSSTSWNVDSADLAVHIRTGPDTFAKVKIGTGIIEEAYYGWDNIRGTPFQLRAGLMEAPFGMDYAGVLASDPYTHGNGPDGADSSYFRQLDSIHDYDDTALDDIDIPGWIGERTRVPGLYGSWHYNDFFKAEGMFFQETHKDRERVVVERAYQNYSTTTLTTGVGSMDDNGIQSFALRLTVSPNKKFKVMSSLINRHNDAKGQSKYLNNGAYFDRDGNRISGNSRGITGGDPWEQALFDRAKEASSNTTAASLAFTYQPYQNWKFFGEYLRNWDMAYYDTGLANVFSAGFDYSFSKKLKLTMLGEHANMSFSSVPVWVAEADINRGHADDIALINSVDMFRLMAGAEYEFDNGIFFGFEIGREWMFRKGESGYKDSRYATSAIISTGFRF